MAVQILPSRPAASGLSTDSISELPTSTTKYYPAFDYLRLVLAIVVAAGHSELILWDASGNYAVQIFFALSGWLIGGNLLQARASDLPRFYFYRAARIWTPYFAAIILLMAASLLKENITAKWLEIFSYDATFVYNIFGPLQLALYKDAMPLQGTGNHFWSICAEEQFYLLSPILITLLPLNIGKSIAFWLLIVVGVSLSVFWGYFGSISLGVLAAVLQSRFGDWHSTQGARVALGLASALGFVAVYAGYVDYGVGAPLSAICIVLFLAQEGPRLHFAAFLGGISYPMYLNHWIGVFAANSVFAKLAMRDTLICKVSGVVLAIAVAILLYLAIDRNVQKLRARYFTVFRGRVVAVLGYLLVACGILIGTTLA